MIISIDLETHRDYQYGHKQYEYLGLIIASKWITRLLFAWSVCYIVIIR